MTVLDEIIAATTIKVPHQGMEIGLKFTWPDQTTYGGFRWPNVGQWTRTEILNPLTCKSGGFHAARTWSAAQSGGAVASGVVFLVGWYAEEAGDWQLDKIKAARMKTLARVDLMRMVREGKIRDLQGADLQDANLRGADLRGANLRDADLQGANLRDADLRDANLRDADLRDADLQDANLRDADLRGANLREANLQQANLQQANLRWANLREADLQGANLREADLQGANLRWADLGGADFRWADLQRAIR